MSNSKFVRVSQLEEIPDTLRRALAPETVKHDKYAHLRQSNPHREDFLKREAQMLQREDYEDRDEARWQNSNQPAIYQQRGFDPDEKMSNVHAAEASSRGVRRVGYETDSPELSMRPSLENYGREGQESSHFSNTRAAAHLFESDLELITDELYNENEKRHAVTDQRNRLEKRADYRKSWEQRQMRKTFGGLKPKRLSDNRACPIVRVANEFIADSDWGFHRDELLTAQEQERTGWRDEAKRQRLAIKRDHITDEEASSNRHNSWQESEKLRARNYNDLASDMLYRNLEKELGRK